MNAAQNLRGIALMSAAMAAFAVEDMFLKFAAAGLPSGLILLLPGVLACGFFAALARREGARTLTRAALHPWVLARNAGEVTGTLAYITAIGAVPLATLSAVLQAMPLAVTLGAALFLGERVGWRRWAAISVGFCGVLLVIRPGMEGFRPAALWVLVTVAGLALRDLAARRIPQEFTTAQVSAWGMASVALLGAVLVPLQPAVLPDLWQAGLLLGALVFGTAGYWAITGASRTGEVAVVAPFRYSRLIFAIAIGTTVFGESLDRMTLAGAGLIIGSGLYALTRERRRRGAQ